MKDSMVEDTDDCVEQAQCTSSLPGPQVSSGNSVLIRYGYLTIVPSTSPIPGRAYMHVILQFLEYSRSGQPRRHREGCSDVLEGDELNTRKQEGYVPGY